MDNVWVIFLMGELLIFLELGGFYLKWLSGVWIGSVLCFLMCFLTMYFFLDFFGQWCRSIVLSSHCLSFWCLKEKCVLLVDKFVMSCWDLKVPILSGWKAVPLLFDLRIRWLLCLEQCCCWNNLFLIYICMCRKLVVVVCLAAGFDCPFDNISCTKCFLVWSRWSCFGQA